jgi:hypothetical protein
MKQFKACGARNLPSIDYGRTPAWLQLAALATTLTAWLRHIGLDADPATAATKTLRFRVLSAPARLDHPRAPPHPQRSHPAGHGPPIWPAGWDRLQALHPT